MHGKNNETLIIVDADAIVAFTDVGDENHTKAKQIMYQLATMQSNFLFPTTAICEAVTVLRSKLNKPHDAEHIVQKFKSGEFPLHAVDSDILIQATTMFNPHSSKKNTLFDAVIAAIAKHVQTDAIFSFDGWYRKIGLRLTEDLLVKEKDAA